jgi:hypothetical protein
MLEKPMVVNIQGTPRDEVTLNHQTLVIVPWGCSI